MPSFNRSLPVELRLLAFLQEFSPEKGNVAFGSAHDGWAFRCGGQGGGSTWNWCWRATVLHGCYALPRPPDETNLLDFGSANRGWACRRGSCWPDAAAAGLRVCLPAAQLASAAPLVRLAVSLGC